MRKSSTHRGFSICEFEDFNGHKCSLQKSSLATQDAIWLGPAKAEPKILASQTSAGGTGWVPYKLPDEVLLTTRMHLDRKGAAKLLIKLTRFVLTGSI